VSVPVKLSTHLSHERKSLNWRKMMHSNLGNAAYRVDNLAARATRSTTTSLNGKDLRDARLARSVLLKGTEELRRDQSKQHRRLGQLKIS
jgi:hypothetical protein